MITTPEEKAQVYHAVEAVLMAQTGDYRRAAPGHDEDNDAAEWKGPVRATRRGLTRRQRSLALQQSCARRGTVNDGV